MNGWANTNDNILRMRLTENQYAKCFISKGTVKFSTPESWVEYAKDHGDGRGDFYEGTIAFCHKNDMERIFEFDDKYGTAKLLNPNGRDLTKVEYKNRILYKDNRSMKLPCFCMYILKNEALKIPEKEGKQNFETSIPGSYFKDFANHMLPEDVAKLPEDEQPALIVISDFERFKERLIKKLVEIGVEEKEILIKYVTYFDFEKYGFLGWYDFQQKYPLELYVKSQRFNEQCEARIVINTRDTKVLERLKKPIDLGNMSDIAKSTKGYFYEGIDISFNAEVYSVE